MKYKMIALDLDGTLTNSKKEVSPRTRDLIIEIQKQGVIVALATGRPVQGAAPISKELQLDVYGGYILSFNGGIIKNCRTGEIIFQKNMPDELVPKLAEASYRYQIPILTYKGDCIVTEDTTDYYVRLEADINKLPVEALENFAEQVNYPIPKCLMVAAGWQLEEIMPKMQEEFGDKVNIFRSEPFFMEITPLGVDKAQGLARLLEHTGVKREELICCGDGYNDLTMIKFAGLGVAMENAQKEVKEIADVITLTNDDDGVAYIIEKYMKNR